MKEKIGFEYKGSRVSYFAAGHPQVQNIEIDGDPVGHVVFPTSAESVAKA